MNSDIKKLTPQERYELKDRLKPPRGSKGKAAAKIWLNGSLLFTIIS